MPSFVMKDDRTPDQRATHTILVAGNDSCLTGWGDAKSGRSIAAWACTPANALSVERWVRSRTDMERVRILHDPVYGRTGDHIHIYVVTDGHPALGGDA